MDHKNIFEFAPLSVGTMRIGDWGAKMNTKEIEEFIEGCLSIGLNDFDHADIYGGYTTEEDFGKALKSNPTLKDKVNLITKCGIKMMSENRPDHKIKSYDLGPKHIRQSVENSLKALSVENIDVLLLHRPDTLIQPEEVAEVFTALKNAGKVSHFGVSNFSTSQFEILNSYTPLITNQIEVSITHLEGFNDGTINQCMSQNIRPMAWSPLGGGGIMGSSEDIKIRRIQKVGNELAEKHSVKLDQILLAWILKHPSKIIPVLGTSKIERIKSAHEALKINLSREEWYELLEASVGNEVA